MNEKTKSAFIAIIGRPNVGKSSLLNSILPYKVAAVSDKPQTTRTRIMGIFTKGPDQLVFMDTPGFHKPRNLLGDNMIKAVNSGIADVDAAILVIDAAPKFKFDADNLPPAEIELINTLKLRQIPTILAINKIDLLKNKEDLLPIIAAYSKYYDFHSIIPISALQKNGIDDILAETLKFTKDSVHYFSDDSVTDQPEKTLVCEIIREKTLRLLDKEIPHGIAVELERFFERDNKAGEPIIEVHAVLYCEKDSHKGIIIGKQGSMLKKIGSTARYDIEEFFGCKCSLKLWVKVKENWRNNAGIIHSLGLEVN